MVRRCKEKVFGGVFDYADRLVQHLMIINDKWLMIKYELSMINYELLIINYWLSIANYQLLITNYFLSVLNNQLFMHGIQFI